ncbi:MAG: TIGR04283 family arsenosugar biosynthesis glycosyltransferase [Gammaproteobacteria bacterium]
MCRLSIVIPVLNDAAVLKSYLSLMQSLRRAGHEIVLVDGGSCDGTQDVARPLVDTVLSARRGRAYQMNAGAAIARGDVLVFVHADTRLPDDAAQQVCAAMRGRSAVWGRFDVRLSGRRWWARMIEWSMNWRSRVTGIATGDQAVFVRRCAFLRLGGFPELLLMEDIAMSRRLKRMARPVCLKARVTTSSRRWETHGWLRTMLLMWGLRLAFALGVNATSLARIYYPDQRDASRRR